MFLSEHIMIFPLYTFVANVFVVLETQNYNQGHPKFQKNVWKPSSEDVFAKFNKLTLGTKHFAPPQGISLVIQKN